MYKKALKKFSFIIAMIIAAACISGCGILPSKALQRFTAEYYDCFDTAITVTAYCSSQKEFDTLSQEIHSDLLEYHRMFDIYNEYDGLANACTVNRSAGSVQAVEVPAALMELVLLGKEMYEKTGGSVNIAMGAVTSLWHEAREKADAGGTENGAAGSSGNASVIPSDAELKAAALHCDINKVKVDEESCTIRLADPAMSLDLGAIAKGFAVQQVRGRLSSEKRVGVLINAGGNVAPQGEKGNQRQHEQTRGKKSFHDDHISMGSSGKSSPGMERHRQTDIRRSDRRGSGSPHPQRGI